MGCQAVKPVFGGTGLSGSAANLLLTCSATTVSKWCAFGLTPIKQTSAPDHHTCCSTGAALQGNTAKRHTCRMPEPTSCASLPHFCLCQVQSMHAQAPNLAPCLSPMCCVLATWHPNLPGAIEAEPQHPLHKAKDACMYGRMCAAILNGDGTRWACGLACTTWCAWSPLNLILEPKCAGPCTSPMTSVAS